MENKKVNNASRKIWLGLFVILVAGMLCRTAVAMPIDGTIAFTGLGTTTGGSDLSTATGLRFDNPILVLGGTKDFSSVGGTAIFTDFTFAPFVAVTPLWTAGDFSFDLTTLTIDEQTTTEFGLSGTGVVKGDGFTDTVGAWSLTSNSAGTTNFSFSTNTVGTGVPVTAPGIVLLLGIGLGGMGISQGWRRRSGSAAVTS
jgi:hypothetical protein